MPTNTLSRDKIRGTTTDTSYLGTDARGREHHWNGVRRILWVFASDDREEIVHVQRDLSHLGHWVEFVAEHWDWDDLQYDDRTLAELADELVAHAEAA